MAVNTSLKIYSRDENLNALQKTVGNINPDAADYVLKNFAVGLMELSQNSYSKVERIDTKDITNATQA